MGFTNNDEEMTEFGIGITGIYYTTKGFVSISKCRMNDVMTYCLRAELFRYASKNNYDTGGQKLSSKLVVYELSDVTELDTNAVSLFYSKKKAEFANVTDDL